MVFNLIGAGIFGKTDEDSIDDFKAVYDFRDAFVKPFQPEPPSTGKIICFPRPRPVEPLPPLGGLSSFMHNRANLKAMKKMESPVISFPPNTAQRWTLANGLTIIVQEDRSAPVASVQAWCGTGSIERISISAPGFRTFSSICSSRERRRARPTRSRKKFRTSAVTSTPTLRSIARFSGSMCQRTGVDRARYSGRCDDEFDVAAGEYVKEQEVIRREFAMGMDDPDRMAGHLLFATAYQRTSLSAAGDRANRYLQSAHTRAGDGVLQDCATFRTISIFVVVGRRRALPKSGKSWKSFSKTGPQVLPPIYIPAEPPQLGRREVHRSSQRS